MALCGISGLIASTSLSAAVVHAAMIGVVRRLSGGGWFSRAVQTAVLSWGTLQN